MVRNKKEAISTAFSWGRKEHYFERWTNNALYATVIMFCIAFHLRSWYLMHYVFAWLLVSLSIHLLARFCHRRESRWHNAYRKR